MLMDLCTLFKKDAPYDMSLVNKVAVRVIVIWEGTTTMQERNKTLKDIHSRTNRFFVSMQHSSHSHQLFKMSVLT